MSEEKLMFRAYLRGLLRELNKVKEALERKDYDEAEKIIDQLIGDTEKGIED